MFKLCIDALRLFGYQFSLDTLYGLSYHFRHKSQLTGAGECSVAVNSWCKTQWASSSEMIMASMHFVLLFLSPLTVSAMECDSNEKCIPQDSCPDFQAEKSIWQNLIKKSKAWNEALVELKERVCDKKTKGVCCPSTEKQGRACKTRRGVEGTCQLEQSCRGSGPPIWGSMELTTCGSLTCCPDWATLDRPVLPSPSNDVDTRTVPKVQEGGLCGLEGSVPFVFGGKEAKEGQFPFMASLVWTSRRTRKVSSFCGGVLITSRHVLTAAHCFSTVTEKDWESEVPVYLMMRINNLIFSHLIGVWKTVWALPDKWMGIVLF